MKKSTIWSIISVGISLLSFVISVIALIYQHDANVKTDYRTGLNIDMREGESLEKFELKDDPNNSKVKNFKAKKGEIQIKNGMIEKMYVITKTDNKKSNPYKIEPNYKNNKFVNGKSTNPDKMVLIHDRPIVLHYHIPYVFYLIKSYNGNYQLYVRVFDIVNMNKKEEMDSKFYDKITILHNDKNDFYIDKVRKEYIKLENYLNKNGVKIES
ncbi:hypothetical protein K4S04_08755 [Staphylococcus epidermidis]|nr:hypothetical protein [Staphylococcus epidermidis]